MTQTQDILPAESAGTEITRWNALKHGVLSRYAVLPWEDQNEYDALVAALVIEHNPQGPTEEHMVEELAGILWRKRRLRLAEAATFRRGLKETTETYRDTARVALIHVTAEKGADGVEDAIRATPEQTVVDLADVDEDEAMTAKAVKILRAGRPDAYERALGAVRDDTREWWEELLTWEQEDFDEGEEMPTADADGLIAFIESKVQHWYAERRRELDTRPLIRDQAIAEALDPKRLERLARYEVHLDRKLERMLAMLLRLKDLRCETIEE
jgi:hypothetical protein